VGTLPPAAPAVDRPTVDPVIVTSRAALVAAVTDGVERALRRAEDAAPAPPADGFGWVTNKEAMRLLGLSKPTLARYRADGTLPFSKVGSSVFYRVADLQALLDGRRADGARAGRSAA